MSLLRRVIGAVLRRIRLRQRRTLREVAQQAGVSLAYLSEIERGRKEASSEVLAAICDALGLRLVDLLDEAREELVRLDRVSVPPGSRRPAVPPVSPARPGTLARYRRDPLARYGSNPPARYRRDRPARYRPNPLTGRLSGPVLRLARCHYATSGSALGRIGFALPGPAGGWRGRAPGEPLAPRPREGGEHAGFGQWTEIGEQWTEIGEPVGLPGAGDLQDRWCGVGGRPGGLLR